MVETKQQEAHSQLQVSPFKPLTAPVAVWDNFLCFTNNAMKTGKSRDAKNSVQGPDMTLQEILHFPPLEVQAVKRHFKECTLLMKHINKESELFFFKIFVRGRLVYVEKETHTEKQKADTESNLHRDRKLFQNHC